jgi:hypothetical protein
MPGIRLLPRSRSELTLLAHKDTLHAFFKLSYKPFQPSKLHKGDENIMAQQKFRVSDKAPQGLFLRSEPVAKDSTKIAVLPMGHSVTKKATSAVANWWEVSTTIDGASVDGFLNSTFLVPDAAFTPPPPVSTIAPVHLPTSASVARGNKARLAYPLNETGQKTRNTSAAAAVKAGELTAIVNWLDVERKARYGPTSQHTYCNIYAYDYCYLARVFLPRVWWLQSAIDKLKQGKAVSPIYGQTVSELNANSLFNWLKDYGPTFGWNRTFDLTQMQNAANGGQVVIICAQNRKPNRSGHICPVVPETASKKATRSGVTVTHPLQSQAGRSNIKYFNRNWWPSATFRDFGFWINAS